MKLEIASNGKINSIKKIGDRVIIDFEPSTNYSDFEMWLYDKKIEYLDHICLNVSKRNKLQAHK